MAIRESTYIRFLSGEVTERITLRQSLARYYGYSCNICSISEWNGKPLTLQVDHINGCAGNNMPSNLRLICPNCHTQTETFGGRNKGNGRKAQGLKTR